MAEAGPGGGPRPSSCALLAPVTANRLSPAASSTSIEVPNRPSRRLKRKATRLPAAATARNRQSPKVAGGRSPSRMSRMMPPPSAVMTPSVSTPTMSTCATRTAVSAPFKANAKVPVRSSATSTGVSVTTPRVSPGRAGQCAHSSRTMTRVPMATSPETQTDRGGSKRGLGPPEVQQTRARQHGDQEGDHRLPGSRAVGAQGCFVGRHRSTVGARGGRRSGDFRRFAASPPAGHLLSTTRKLRNGALRRGRQERGRSR